MNPSQSGNLDFPPLSSAPSNSNDNNAPPNLPPRFPAPLTSPNVASVTELPNLQARLQQLRELLSLEREASSSQSSTDRQRRQDDIGYLPSSTTTDWPLRSPHPPQSTNNRNSAPEIRLRRRATPSERYLQRSRAFQQQRPGASRLPEPISGLENMAARQDELIANLEYEGEAEVNRRNKRRKLDGEMGDVGVLGFSYGRYGQVEPGELRMEIVSCDGGIFKEDDGTYLTENVLRDDSSVYCTDRNRCNIVLRHKGGTAFTLTKLVIKAPRRGFTAPVREGMVFISMTSDDVLTRTAQYKIRYPPATSNSTPSSIRINARQSRRLAAPPFRTPDAAQTETTRLISVLNRRSDLTNPGTLPIPPEDELVSLEWASARMRQTLQDSSAADDDDRSPYENAENCDFPLINLGDDSQASHADVLAPTPPPFTVTTDCSDDEDESSLNFMSDRGFRSGRRPVIGLWDDGEEDENDPLGLPGRRYPVGRWGEQWRHSGITPLSATGRATLHGDEGTLQAEPALGEERVLLAPHAKFSIKRDKGKCSIKFDPPVSGRFILLKLWSPSRDRNIDIQSVVAHGFAGPRFFPAVEMR